MTTTAPAPTVQRTAAQKNAMTLAYEDLQPLIETTVRGFCRKYRQPYDEARATASLIFAKEYDKWYASDGKQAMSVWMRYCIWNQLLDGIRYNMAKCRMPDAPMAGHTALAMVAAKDAAPVDVMAKLSPDAALVADLALDMPVEMHKEAQARGGTPRNIRSVIRQRLYTLGWSRPRVEAAYTELAQA